MSYDVYLLRFRGVKLAPEQVRERVRRGYLELGKRDDGAPGLIATLRSERGGLAGEMQNASVTRILPTGGLMLAGFEISGSRQYRQAWWCAPVRE